MCLCEQQADLTQPDFIPIRTQCCHCALYIAGASYGAFHLLYDCFGFLAGVGWFFFNLSFSFLKKIKYFIFIFIL
jgi:hypothetical protein